MSGKERILQHMNRDHTISLYDYLAYYAGIRVDPSSPSHSAELVDVDLGSITLNYTRGGPLKTTVIPLDPPLKSLADSRVRLTKMALEAADAYHVSPYQIKKYIRPPIPGALFSLGTIAAALLSISPQRSFGLLSRYSPRFAEVVRKRVRSILLVTLFIHFLEYVKFMRPLLNKHRIYGTLRIKYQIAGALEGFWAWSRLLKESRRLEQARQKFETQFS